MELTIKKREGPVFIADLEQLKRLGPLRPSDRLVVGGTLLACALSQDETLNGMVKLPARETRKLTLANRKPSAKLHVGIERDALALLIQRKARPVFAVDAMLRYGTRLKAEEVVLLSVAPTSNGSVANLMRFRKGVLEEVADFGLSSPTGHTFEVDVHALVARLRLRHASAVFHWCGPVSLPASQNMVQAPPNIWTSAPVQAVTMTGRASVLQRHGAPALVVLLAAAAYIGALWVPYTQYRSAAAELASDNARLKGEYQFASERLALLRALQSFARASENNTQPLERFQAVVAAASEQEGLRIREARLNWPGQRQAQGQVIGEPYDFELQVEVARLPGTTALDQSVPLLQALSAATGLSVRLATVDGMREAQAGADKGATRVYRVQGDFKHGA